MIQLHYAELSGVFIRFFHEQKTWIPINWGRRGFGVIAFVINSNPCLRMMRVWVETLVKFIKFTNLTPEGVYGKRCPIFQNHDKFDVNKKKFSRQIETIHETKFKIVYICMDGFSCRPKYLVGQPKSWSLCVDLRNLRFFFFGTIFCVHFFEVC